MKILTAVISISLLLLHSPAFAVINVFACEPEWKSLIETLGGKHVETYSATTAFQDPHHIEARPSLIAKARQADLLVCTGAELEIGWLPLLLRQSGNARIQKGEPGYFLAASHVERIGVPTNLDRSQGDVHASGNPHVHWDPKGIMTIAQALTERLQVIDSENSADYQQLFDIFNRSWNESIERWELTAEKLKGKKVVVYHKSWNYLLNWLEIEVIGDLEPKPGIPPTSSHLANLLRKVRSEKPAYILITNYQDDKGARWLGDKTHVPVLKLPFTVGGNSEAQDLISLYNEVITALTK